MPKKKISKFQIPLLRHNCSSKTLSISVHVGQCSEHSAKIPWKLRAIKPVSPMAVPDRRRSLPQPHHCGNAMLHQEDEVPSDEEAQDNCSSKPKKLVFLGTPSRRRRSRSLHSTRTREDRLLPFPTHKNRPPTLSLNGYESEPSDLSSAASDSEQETLLPVDTVEQPSPESLTFPSSSSTNTKDIRACYRRWPFRLLLLTCTYIAWTVSMECPDSLLVKKRNMPVNAAAFSSQHGREVVIQPMEEHSPLRDMSKETYIPPTSTPKRRPNVAFARAGSKPAPILGQQQATMERFVMEDTSSGDATLTTSHDVSHSRFYYVACIALILLFLETTLENVRRRCVLSQGRRRQGHHRGRRRRRQGRMRNE